MILHKTIILFFIIISLITFGSYPVNAQEDLSFENVEARTYELYKNLNWKELIRFGERAIRERLDSYSLRFRLGTAYYKIENYFLAITNFEKALEIGFEDDLIYEYLYYSYLFTGRNEDKNYVFSKLTDSKKISLLPLYNSILDNILVEYGKSGITEVNTEDVKLLVLNNNSYSEQTIPEKEFYFNAGMSQQPFNRLNISYEYSLNNSRKNQEIYSPLGYVEYSNEYSRKQSRFYNKLDILASRGLTISPSAHYINIKESRLVFDSLSSTGLLNFTKRDFNTDNFIFSITANKFVSIFRLGINGSFSFLNEKHQSQYGLSLKIFPFGNAGLTGDTKVSLHKQDNVSNIIISQSIGVNIVKNLHLFTTALFGKIRNFNFDNGRSVYNDPDLLKLKINAGLTYNITNNLSLKLSFDHQQRERNFIAYDTYYMNANKSGEFSYSYYVNAFSAGMQFYF